MTGATRRRRMLALLLPVLAAACRTTHPATADDVRPTTAPTTAPAASSGAARTANADVRFMQRMLGHHAQALTMAALVPTHSRRAELRTLAARIDATQREEMTQMRRWLTSRGHAVPADDAHAGHAMGDHAATSTTGGTAGMPGMLGPQELAQLGRSTGPTFDRLFLEGMIRHHEGALTMVAEFFATPGAAQEPEIFRLASDVDADQRAEIRRMRALLAAATTTPAP